jgi:hypothetical protein
MASRWAVAALHGYRTPSPYDHALTPERLLSDVVVARSAVTRTTVRRTRDNPGSERQQRSAMQAQPGCNLSYPRPVIALVGCSTSLTPATEARAWDPANRGEDGAQDRRTHRVHRQRSPLGIRSAEVACACSARSAVPFRQLSTSVPSDVVQRQIGISAGASASTRCATTGARRAQGSRTRAPTDVEAVGRRLDVRVQR